MNRFNDDNDAWPLPPTYSNLRPAPIGRPRHVHYAREHPDYNAASNKDFLPLLDPPVGRRRERHQSRLECPDRASSPRGRRGILGPRWNEHDQVAPWGAEEGLGVQVSRAEMKRERAEMERERAEGTGNLEDLEGAAGGASGGFEGGEPEKEKKSPSGSSDEASYDDSGPPPSGNLPFTPLNTRENVANYIRKQRHIDDPDNEISENFCVDVDAEERLLELTERTGYSLLQRNGQRIFGGPPPGWQGPPPGRGTEVFVGKVPRGCIEADLVPMFAKIGLIYELRLMMDFSGSNRGYFFVRYTNTRDARRAIEELNNYEIRPNKRIGVLLSVDNRRLWISGIPKNRSAEEIRDGMALLTEGVNKVILYPSQMDKNRTRGYAFVEYTSHRAAALARRTLIPKTNYLFGHEIEKVDWAEPEQEVDEEIMKNVSVLFLRNLQPCTTELQLRQIFEEFIGEPLERVKKSKDYAFVHFFSRKAAERAIECSRGLVIDEAQIEVSWSKPVDKNTHNQRKHLTRILSTGGGYPRNQHFNSFYPGGHSPFMPRPATANPNVMAPPFVPNAGMHNFATGANAVPFPPRAPGTAPPRRLLRQVAAASNGPSSFSTNSSLPPIGVPMRMSQIPSGDTSPTLGGGVQATPAHSVFPSFGMYQNMHNSLANIYFPPPMHMTPEFAQQAASYFTPTVNSLPFMPQTPVTAPNPVTTVTSAVTGPVMTSSNGLSMASITSSMAGMSVQANQPPQRLADDVALNSKAPPSELSPINGF